MCAKNAILFRMTTSSGPRTNLVLHDFSVRNTNTSMSFKYANLFPLLFPLFSTGHYKFTILATKTKSNTWTKMINIKNPTVSPDINPSYKRFLFKYETNLKIILQPIIYPNLCNSTTQRPQWMPPQPQDHKNPSFWRNQLF